MKDKGIVSFCRQQKRVAIYLCCILFLTSNLNLMKTVLEVLNISESFATYISIILSMALCLFIFAIFICGIISDKNTNALIIFVILNFIYMLPYIVHMDFIGIIKYSCFILPFSCLGILLVTNINGQFLFMNFFLRLNNFALGIAIIYIIYLFFAEDNYVGYLSYGDIAYIFLPFLVANIYSTFQMNQRWINRIISCVVYIITILYTGTRSAMLCIVFLLIGELIYLTTIKKMKIKDLLKSSFTILLVLCVCAVLVTTNLTPKASRLNVFKDNIIYENENTENIKKEEFVAQQEDPDTRQEGSDIKQEEHNVQQEEPDIQQEELNSYNLKEQFIELIVKEDYSAKEAEEIINSEAKDIGENFYIEYNRITLWTIAIEELKAYPLFGGGLNNFERKVGMTAHNVILEAFADFGLIGGTIFTGGIAFLFIYNFFIIKKNTNRNFYYILLFIFSFIPFHLLFTGLYFNGRLIFSVSFLLMNYVTDHKEINTIKV